ncbi:MAG: addiction module toxin, HicA family [Planctomycetota bacterium]|nr:MAG: addiction module toxin, HicA family [Planctomycetota bacterium]
MKRVDFIRQLEQAGCELHRHGSRHDVYQNPATGKKAPVPRHREISNSLCRLIRRQLGVEAAPGES